VESDSATIEVKAGKFANCLKLKTVITPSSDSHRPAQDQRFSFSLSGTKQSWFAPGVGPVKLVLDMANGTHIETDLAEYSVKDGEQDYFPLSVGNEWTYHWAGLDEQYVTRDCYRIAAREGNTYYLDHYGYALFRRQMGM